MSSHTYRLLRNSSTTGLAPVGAGFTGSLGPVSLFSTPGDNPLAGVEVWLGMLWLSSEGAAVYSNESGDWGDEGSRTSRFLVSGVLGSDRGVGGGSTTGSSFAGVIIDTGRWACTGDGSSSECWLDEGDRPRSRRLKCFKRCMKLSLRSTFLGCLARRLPWAPKDALGSWDECAWWWGWRVKVLFIDSHRFTFFFWFLCEKKTPVSMMEYTYYQPTLPSSRSLPLLLTQWGEKAWGWSYKVQSNSEVFSIMLKLPSCFIWGTKSFQPWWFHLGLERRGEGKVLEWY